MRSYSGMLQLATLEERFRYLALQGKVGDPTFGSRRFANQGFYTSREWRDIRHHIIGRDNGCDLAVIGYDIYKFGVIHHINPLTIEDVENRSSACLDPNNLVLTARETHNAIHYGDERLLPQEPIERRPGDTIEW